MLVAIRTTGSRPPLFVMHGASGICDGALPVEGLSADQPIYGVEARGIDGAAAPLASVEEMCSAYADEVVAAQPTGPYLFAGVGRGAIAAVEVARELETRGMTVGSVFMLDPGLAPHHTPRALARIEAGLKNPAVGRQLFEHARNSLPALVRNSPRRPFDPGQPEIGRAHV